MKPIEQTSQSPIMTSDRPYNDITNHPNPQTSDIPPLDSAASIADPAHTLGPLGINGFF